MDVLVEVRGLEKRYKTADGEKTVVKGIDLDIYKGEVFSLLGPNGAGKTTTISMISGLLPMTAGSAVIGGYSVATHPLEAKARLGVVPQEIALYPRFSARQNLAFFGKLYGLNGAELNRRIDEVLDFVDLTDRQHDRVETFSGGMKRRVNIAVGLIHRPQLVYMDEPTVGIDPQNRRRILDTVKRLRDEQGMTVLYTTHLMEEAQELSDRVGIIDHGKIIALGTVAELTQRVGEEDRLIFTVAATSIEDRFLRQLEQDIAGVSRAVVELIASEGDTKEVQLVVLCNRGRRAMPEIITLTNAAGLDVVSIEVREPDLEAVFLDLTGRALRD
ncbi:MAG: ABC transporter ATP-binding protein [Phototrophicaceae bacterium]